MTRPQLVMDGDGRPVTPEVVIEAYQSRCFPMADDRDGSFHWYRPDTRAVITWDRWHIPRSLRKLQRQQPYRLTVNTAFERVVQACADRAKTWICRDIETLYLSLHDRRLAHSVEAWDDDQQLVGGLYGLAIGGCFCGESMFHIATNASKLCVTHLVARLQDRGFSMLDCQQQTPHMARFGAVEISDEDYAQMLAECESPCAFD